MSLYSWSVGGNRWMPVKPGNVWAWSVHGNRWLRVISMKSWSVSANKWLEIFPDPTIADLYTRSEWGNVSGRVAGSLLNISTSGGIIWGGTTVKRSYGINNMIRRLVSVKIQYRILGRGTAQTLKFQIGTTTQIHGNLHTSEWGNGIFEGWIDVDTREPVFDLYIINIGINSGDGAVIGDVKPVEFRFAD